jgi:UDP-3-O-[3-hydroxymyristoyl] glucosamine N-acyltransferase
VSTAYRLGELADEIGGNVRGDRDRVVTGVATLERAGPDELSFLTNRRYRAQAERTCAGAVLVAPGTDLEGHDLLEADEPYLALAKLLELFHPSQPVAPGLSDQAWVAEDVRQGRGVWVGPFAVVDAGAWLGDDVVIGAGCFVGSGSRIGTGTELKPRVVLYPGTELGERCLIHSGVVLGGDGYGFATSGGRHHKVPQMGRVVVEDDVEIGANSTVDRGALGDTRIGRGSKIDNLVMVGHGAQIGEHCLLAGQAGISGSTTVGEGSVFAGQAGAAGHLTIPAGTVVAAKSAMLGDPPGPGIFSGIPATDHKIWKRSQVVVKKLPELQRQLTDLRSRVEELERRKES